MKGGIISLGPLAAADSEPLWAWINDRDLVLCNAPYHPVHEATHHEWFAAVQRRADLAIFAIRANPDNRLIGVCQLHSIHPVHHAAELQIRIGDAAWRGKGAGREAMNLLLKTGFRDLNLRRIYLHVLAGNTVAIRLYEKLGFVHEGRLRQAVHIDGRYQDVLLMALLRPDFAAPTPKGGP